MLGVVVINLRSAVCLYNIYNIFVISGGARHLFASGGLTKVVGVREREQSRVKRHSCRVFGDVVRISSPKS